MKMEVCMETKKWSLNNAVKNWYIIVSVAGFAVMQIRLNPSYVISLIGMLIAAVYIIGRTGTISDYVKGQNKYIRIYSFVNSVGIVYANYNIMFIYLESFFVSGNGKADRILSALRIGEDDFWMWIRIFLVMADILSFGVVYALTGYICSKILNVLKDIEIYRFMNGLQKSEKMIYFILLFIQMIMTITFFRVSVAGYSGPCNIIYGTDSAIYGNIMNFLHVDILNIRQPLLELTASPFVGFTFLFTVIPAENAWIASVLAQLVQVMLLFLSNIMLIKLMDIKYAKNRIAAMLLLVVSYSGLEGILIVEKYIFAYFWIIIYISWFFCGKENNKRFVSDMLIGSMVTSAFLLPFAEFERCGFSFRDTAKNMVFRALSFMGTLMLTFHLGLVYSVKISNTFSYVGTKIPWGGVEAESFSTSILWGPVSLRRKQK